MKKIDLTDKEALKVAWNIKILKREYNNNLSKIEKCLGDLHESFGKALNKNLSKVLTLTANDSPFAVSIDVTQLEQGKAFLLLAENEEEVEFLINGPKQHLTQTRH